MPSVLPWSVVTYFPSVTVTVTPFSVLLTGFDMSMFTTVPKEAELGAVTPSGYCAATEDVGSAVVLSIATTKVSSSLALSTLLELPPDCPPPLYGEKSLLSVM